MNISKGKLKKKSFSIIANIFRYIFFISFSYVVLYPFIFILIGSVKGVQDFIDPTVTWVPKNFNLQNIVVAAKALDFKNTFWNTIYLQIFAALIQFASCAFAAYGLARFKFVGRKLLYGFMLLNILVPTMLIIVPSYVNYSYMDFLGILVAISKLVGKELRPNLINTPFVYYLPSLFGVGLKGGLFIYIFSQFYKSLPKELEEAAWIDGAGPVRTFFKIVAPSSGSASLTVLIFSVVWHWNEYYTVQMYTPQLPTVSLAIRNMTIHEIAAALGDASGMTNAVTNQSSVYICSALLLLLPLIIFYLIVQRKFMASVATSGIVG